MTYKDKHIAQDAARNPFSHIEPQIATVYHFCLMHYGSPDDPNYKLAEAMNEADDFDRHMMMLEFASTYCKENGIPWSNIEILGKAVKYGRFRVNEYHFTFRALVMLNDRENKREDENDEAQQETDEGAQ